MHKKNNPVWGAGQQQVRNIWTNLAAYHSKLWIHTRMALWSWNWPYGRLRARSRFPWDDADGRPSHADRTPSGILFVPPV